MKFEISNLGYIKQAEIELGDLTIICGKNNTSKTYVNYAIYGFLKTWKLFLDFKIENKIESLFTGSFIKINLVEYKDQFLKSLVEFSKVYSDLTLCRFLGIDKNLLSNSLFLAKFDNFNTSYSSIEIDDQLGGWDSQEPIVKVKKELNNNFLEVTISPKQINNTLPNKYIEDFVNQAIAHFFTSYYCIDVFTITSERTGVSLFYKELDLNKNLMIGMMKNQLNQNISFDVTEILNERTSRYSKPVQDEINFVRDLDTISKRIGELAKNNPEIIDLLIDIIGGDYNVTDYSMSFRFTEDNKPQEIPLYSASSTVKSLMNLYFYLKHLAKPGDILTIDEPELNLHPENQRKLAKLFTRLTKCGLKLLMTTHSDYLIKELNNLIILKNEFERKSELMEEYKYSEEDILESDQVRVYIAENNTLNPAKITQLGIEVPTFDDEIINMTDFYDEAYYEVIDNIDI